MAVQVLRRRFTVEDYHRMAEAGILMEDDRVELIRGEVVEMSPIGNRHAACVNRLTEVFVRSASGRAVIAPQNPVRIPEHSEPQPDLTVLRRREDHYAGKAPQPEDVLLLVEVCDTSLAYDRDVKVPLYAEAGIPEVWLVDLNAGIIHVFRDPSPAGYRRSHSVLRGEGLAPELLSGLAFSSADLLV